ncbi:energy transducer TonB [Sunxiuqinia sp. sy24]|uniref:energy transducer TonB n=1 Tax=Sunxiuqinia sp. sy24 TaxID=3461495 RepID=UPI0040468773
MELKKSPKADLESKRNIFVQIGLVVSLGLCLLAFEWTTKVEQASSLGTMAEQEVEDEIIPITRQEEVKPPPPPPPPKVVEVLNIVEDDVEIEDELEIQDTDIDEETAIEVAPVIQEEEEEEEGQVFFIVEDMPEFPGGELALRKFIANAVKYPVIAQENGIQGKVYVNFVVDKDGSITNARIARGVDASLDKEALRVVNSLPKWKPGQQRGKAVRVSYTVPINFVLQ